MTQNELNRLIEERNQLRSQVIAGNNNPDAPSNSVFQTELSALNTEISAKIDDLEALSLQLNALVTNVSSQGVESGASQSALVAEAERLRSEIASKEAEVAELERRIRALLNQLDLVAVEQREAFEDKKARLEADLATDRENLARIEAQLN